MNHARRPWVYFRIPPLDNPLLIDRDPFRYHELIVYKNPQGKFYFFGNSVAWCLKFPVPHTAVQDHVGKEHQHRVPFGSGIFLNEEGVTQLAHQALLGPRFLAWFEEYVRKCTVNPFNEPDCPT